MRYRIDSALIVATVKQQVKKEARVHFDIKDLALVKQTVKTHPSEGGGDQAGFSGGSSADKGHPVTRPDQGVGHPYTGLFVNGIIHQGDADMRLTVVHEVRQDSKNPNIAFSSRSNATDRLGCCCAR